MVGYGASAFALRASADKSAPNPPYGYGSPNKKPAADFSAAGCCNPRDQVLLISTSLVSGRKKKPTTAVMEAKMIGYHRPA